MTFEELDKKYPESAKLSKKLAEIEDRFEDVARHPEPKQDKSQK